MKSVYREKERTRTQVDFGLFFSSKEEVTEATDSSCFVQRFFALEWTVY